MFGVPDSGRECAPSRTKAASGKFRIAAARWSDKQLGGAVNAVKNIDLAPDGKRIAALMPAAEVKGSQEAQNHVVFLENFFDELRRKVPLGAK